jgi:hypothetical protein
MPDRPGGVQYLRFGESGVEPLDPAVGMDAIEEAGVEQDGIGIMLIEMLEPTEDQLRETMAGHILPEGFGPALTYLFFVNQRR